MSKYNKRNNNEFDQGWIDVLMITYNRPEYTRKSLERLFQTSDDKVRIWVWHNGTCSETRSIVEHYFKENKFFEYFYSPQNKGLNEPTNWLWKNATGEFVTKVDDDCLMPVDWAHTLRLAHNNNPDFGVIGCWRFPQEDFIPDVAAKKIETFSAGHTLMRNAWIEGSGYVMKRRCIETNGYLREKDSFTQYCIRCARSGWINGWYFPFLYQEHFDDPRSKHSLLKTDDDIERWAPLSAKRNGVTTIAGWEAQLKRSARQLQEAPYHPKYYSGFRKHAQSLRRFSRRLIGIKRLW